MNLIETLEREAIDALTKDKPVPEFRPGDTLRVGVKVIEGDRTRVQNFEGVCIARANKGVGSSFTVRKISFGEGVERVFPLYSPIIDSIEVVRRGDVRRAKLYYLRGRTGKAARIAERRDIRRDVARRTGRRDRGLSASTRASACVEHINGLARVARGMRLPRSLAAVPLCALRSIARSRQRSSARTGVLQPLSERADAARSQAVAGRPFRHAAEATGPPTRTATTCGRSTPPPAPRGCSSIQLKIGSGGAISEEEKMRRERARIAGTKGITDYEWAPDSRSILVPIDGDLYVATLDGNVRRLTNTPGNRDRRQGLGSGPLFLVPARPQSLRDGRLDGSRAPADQRRRRHAELGRGRVRRAGGARRATPAIGGRPTTATSRWRGSTKARSGSSNARRSAPRGTESDRAALSRRRARKNADRRSLPDDSRRQIAGKGRSRHRPRSSICARRLGEGRTQPVRPAPQPRPEAPRHAAGRSGDRPLDILFSETSPHLGEPHRQFQAAEGRQPDLVVGAQRLFASLSLERAASGRS